MTTTPIGRIYVSVGNLPDIRALDFETLDEIDRLSTPNDQNGRIVVSDYLEEEKMKLLAFGGYDRSSDIFHVCVHNSTTGEYLSQLNGVPGVEGLEILSRSSLMTTPILVTGSGGETKRLCAYDALTAETLIDRRENVPFDVITRIKGFPEWNPNEVFIGGSDDSSNGVLFRYDFTQDCVMLGSYVGHAVESGYSYVNGIASSPSNGILLSGSNDNYSEGTLKLWSKDTFECIESVELDHSCHSLHYSSNTHLICCGTENEIEIFDIRNMRNSSNVQNRLPKVENVGNGRVRDLDQISNGSDYSSSLFVSGCKEFVSVWNSVTGKVLRRRQIPVEGSRRKSCDIFGIRFISSLSLPSSSEGTDRFCVGIDNKEEDFLARFSERVTRDTEEWRESIETLRRNEVERLAVGEDAEDTDEVEDDCKVLIEISTFVERVMKDTADWQECILERRTEMERVREAKETLRSVTSSQDN